MPACRCVQFTPPPAMQTSTPAQCRGMPWRAVLTSKGLSSRINHQAFSKGVDQVASRAAECDPGCRTVCPDSSNSGESNTRQYTYLVMLVLALPQDARLRARGSYLLARSFARALRFLATPCAAAVHFLECCSSCTRLVAAARICSSTCCTLMNAACREAGCWSRVQGCFQRKPRAGCNVLDAHTASNVVCSTCPHGRMS
jgi:hypothetical protein